MAAGPVSHGSRSAIARAVREGLSSVVDPSRVERIMEAALAAAGLSDVPETALLLSPFVVALLDQVERAAGEDAANMLEAELDRLLQTLRRLEAMAGSGAASSGTVPKDVHRAVTARTIAPELIVLTSPAPNLAPRLRQQLGGGVSGMRTGSSTRLETTTIHGLRFLLMRVRAEHPIVVIDARDPIEPPARPPVGTSFPCAALVIWGEYIGTDELAWLSPSMVVRCSAEVELVDLACLLRTSVTKVA